MQNISQSMSIYQLVKIVQIKILHAREEFKINNDAVDITLVCDDWTFKDY